MSEDKKFAELMDWMQKDTLMRKQKFRDIKHYLELANERDATIVELDGQVEAFYKMGQQQAQELKQANSSLNYALDIVIPSMETRLEQAGALEKINVDTISGLESRIAELESRASAEFVKKSNRFGAPNGG